MSNTVATAIATWTFVLAYTFAMLLWIYLHKVGVLHIDSQDFIKYNLFLSWAAGIQASVVLMASNRQSESDRKKINEGVELDKKVLEATTQQELKTSAQVSKMTKKLNDICNKIEKLEEIIGLIEEEETESKKEQKSGKEKKS